jgi:DnaK suppressor protein
MSRIESEARDLLLNRRESLHRRPVHGREDLLAASWRADEPVPEPVAEVTRRELGEIEDALRRIEAGSYGNCEACGGAMGLQRMRAIPEARFCMGCSGRRARNE